MVPAAKIMSVMVRTNGPMVFRNTINPHRQQKFTQQSISLLVLLLLQLLFLQLLLLHRATPKQLLHLRAVADVGLPGEAQHGHEACLVGVVVVVAAVTI